MGWTRKILELVGLKRARLSLVLVDDSQIRRYHRRFRGHDWPTDVLAFEPRRGKYLPETDTPFFGDVIVSVQTAKRVAPRFGNRWDEELLLYLCHGILHLRGYRDSTPRQKVRMEKKQETILRKALGGRWRSKKRKRLF